jgi:hypothetical protein
MRPTDSPRGPGRPRQIPDEVAAYAHLLSRCGIGQRTIAATLTRHEKWGQERTWSRGTVRWLIRRAEQKA